jgi:hypothetical protein
VSIRLLKYYVNALNAHTLLFCDQLRKAFSSTLRFLPTRIKGKSALNIILRAVGKEQPSASATSLVPMNLISTLILSPPFHQEGFLQAQETPYKKCVCRPYLWWDYNVDYAMNIHILQVHISNPQN